MLTKSITHDGREYHCTAEVCRLAYVTDSMLRRYAGRGLPHIECLGRKWYNVGDVKDFFASRAKKQIPRTLYKQDDVIIGGRLYHPYRWYRERYYIWHYQLASLPCVERGQRIKLIAEEDFMREFGDKERRK